MDTVTCRGHDRGVEGLGAAEPCRRLPPDALLWGRTALAGIEHGLNVLIRFGGCLLRADARRSGSRIMSQDDSVSAPRDLLRRLARHDEHSLRTVLALLPTFPGGEVSCGSSLDRRTRLLVRLAALLVVDAPTDSLRWAVDLASTSGADDDTVAAVLLAAGSAAGSAQLVASAPRLALALGFDAADSSRPLSGSRARPGRTLPIREVLKYESQRRRLGPD
jgi:4-carboxymuconolactone decarboxylase